MRIFIYWNRIDSDSKKMYRFLRSEKFLEKFEKEFVVDLYKPFCAFPVEGDVEKRIKDSDVIMFFTHGMEDRILKSQYRFENEKKRFTFIDYDNASILANKKVIAICCSSAKCLGPHCIEQVESQYYIGFQDDITYDDGKHIDLRGIIYQAYSDAFEKTFSDSLSLKCSATQFVTMLKKNINDMLTKNILCEKRDHSLGSISQVNFHRKSADSLIALGHGELPLFL